MVQALGVAFVPESFKGFINETDQEGWTVPDEAVLIGDSECLLIDGDVIEDEQKTLL